MKINGQEVLGDKFAYDGCHKIYVCESDADVEQAESYNYKVYDIKGIQLAYDSSCSLKFISNWGLTKKYVNQFEDAVFQD